LNTLRLIRLQDVVDGIHIESIDRVLIESRGKDNPWRIFRAGKMTRHFQPVRSRHFNIQKNHLRYFFFDLLQSLAAVRRHIDHCEIPILHHKSFEFLASKGLIVHHHNPNHFWPPLFKGISIIALVPTPASVLKESFAAPAKKRISL